jgi:hypothetical protein
MKPPSNKHLAQLMRAQAATLFIVLVSSSVAAFTPGSLNLTAGRDIKTAGSSLELTYETTIK